MVTSMRTVRGTVRQTFLLIAIALGAVSTGAQAPAADALALRIIVVESEEDARRVRTRLENGEDFGMLARALSVDPSAPEGGLLGALDVTSLRPELQAALRGVGPGELSPIVPVMWAASATSPLRPASTWSRRREVWWSTTSTATGTSTS